MKKIDFAFLDSGTGGIPYMLYLKEHSPYANCVYLADNKNFPYGEKTPDEVCIAAINAVNLLLLEYEPCAIVIACNTMSVSALDVLRKKFFPIPFIGTVPAIKLAAGLSKKKSIGLLATNRTIAQSYTKDLVSEFAFDCAVCTRGDPCLVDFIEKRLFFSDKKEIIEAIKPSCDFFKKCNVDTVVLGCTHFTHIADEIQRECGELIRVIDSREGVVRQALKVCYKETVSFCKVGEALPSIFYCTGKESECYDMIATTYGIRFGGCIGE